MSSTRYAEEGSPLAQHRYASAEEYAEQRGVQGTALVAKASLYPDERKRNLLYSLQYLSLKEGGFRQIAKKICSDNPDRIGTEKMREIGIRPGRVYLPDVERRVRRELFGTNVPWSIQKLQDEQEEAPDVPGEVLIEMCADAVEKNLPGFLTALCIDPKEQIVMPGEDEDHIDQERIYACLQDESVERHDYRKARLWHFDNIVEALLDFFKRRQQAVWADLVNTSISQQIIDKLKYATRTQGMVTIEADAGRGKSEATRAFCDANPGTTRLISLTGNADKTTFFRLISKACGLPATPAMNCNKMRLRVEDFFQRSKLMLCIDEAHHLWPPGKRTCRNPELIDWIDTALCNYGVPVALVATKEFSRRRGRVEEVSGWNSEQFRRRNRRHVVIDDVPTTADLVAVARKLLPEATDIIIERLLDYADSTGGYFQALVDTVSDARLLAEDAGRSKVIERDIKKALKEFRMPSDANQKRHMVETTNHRRSGRAAAPAPPPSDRRAAAIEPETNRVAALSPAPA